VRTTICIARVLIGLLLTGHAGVTDGAKPAWPIS
jgi:hypothetical protein